MILAPSSVVHAVVALAKPAKIYFLGQVGYVDAEQQSR